MIVNVIFDMDGTLIDSSGDIIDCIKHAYTFTPSLLPIVIDKSFIGPPLNDVIKKVTPKITELQLKIVSDRFRKCYDKSTYKKTCLLPEVELTLNSLNSLSINTFIATNKPKLATYRILKKLKLNSFKDIITIDTLSLPMSKTEIVSFISAKYNLNPTETLLVGDTPSDINAAHSNNLKSVAVTYGYGKLSDLKNANPTYVIDSLAQLLNICK